MVDIDEELFGTVVSILRETKGLEVDDVKEYLSCWW